MARKKSGKTPGLQRGRKAKQKNKSAGSYNTDYCRKGGLITKDEIITGALKRIRNLEEIHEQRKKQHTFSDAIAYWSFLLLVLISNFFISIITIGLILFLNSPLLYIIIIFMGLGFGIVYERCLNGMSHIFLHHHIFAKFFVIATGAINIFYIATFSEHLADFLGIGASYSFNNSLGIGVVYFAAYLTPYAISFILKKIS